MANMTTDPTTFTSRVLVCDTVTVSNSSCDSIPGFTTANGSEVSAALEVQSTLGALLLPRMTTAERDALNAYNGMMIYNTTTNDTNFYEDGGWVSIPSVILPTVANNIARFADTTGTLEDSDVRVLQNFALANLYLGRNTGNVAALAAGISVVAIGVSTLPSITFGSASTESVCVGSGVGLHATGVDDCTFVGSNIASAVASGSLNQLTAVGSNALANVVQAASGLTAVGYLSQQFATTATNCTTMGFASLRNITVAATAADTTAVGSSAMITATTALRTSAFGSGAGDSHASYTDCTFVGQGADNTVSGLTGTTVLGKGATAAANNSTAIGINATVATENSMVLGAVGTNVGINTTSPIANLHINGTIAYSTPVIVPTGDFPYNVQATDTFIIGFPTGNFPPSNQVVLPDADANNLGRAFYISNSSGGADILNVVTVSNQTVQPNNLSPQSGAIYIAYYDGVNYRYYGSC